MLKFFKRILAGQRVQEDQAGTSHRAAVDPQPAPPRSNRLVSPPGFSPRPRPAQSNGHTNANPAPAARRQVTPRPNEAEQVVRVQLLPIVNGLSAECKARLKQSVVNETLIAVPLDKVLPQLSLGSVKITFGDLRRAAPTAFTTQNDLDQVLVSLPLGEILTQINPALLIRRPNQASIEVPDDIRSPFGDVGQGLVFSVGPGGKTAATPQRTVTPVASAPVPPSPIQAAPPLAAPKVPQVTPAEAAPAPIPFRPSLAPTSAPQPPAVALATPPPTFVAAPPRPPTLVPAAPAPPTFVPATPAAPTFVPATPPAPIFVAATPPAPNFAPTTPQAPTFAAAVPSPTTLIETTGPAPTPAAVVADEERVMLPLAQLSEGWPEALRLEISQRNLVLSAIAMPLSTLKESLQRGKASFTWKTLRGWLVPALPPFVSAQDNATVDLPLNVVAPLFIARQRDLAQAKQKVAVDEAIPNLFFGFPQPEAAPAAPKAPPPTASCAVTRPVDTNYYSMAETAESAPAPTDTKRVGPTGTALLKRAATPQEIVTRAAAIPGIAGALVALPDGLMVAGKIADTLNGETIAAFLPQIFARVSQCTNELRMGELNNLSFTVGQVPWKIFRVNAIFFAAFGSPGQPLSTPELAALAGELDHKKQ